MAWFHQPRAQILRFYGLIMLWNEFRIHKTSKFGLFVNKIKPIKFWFTIARFLFSSYLSNYDCTQFEQSSFLACIFLKTKLLMFYLPKSYIPSLYSRAALSRQNVSNKFISVSSAIGFNPWNLLVHCWKCPTSFLTNGFNIK